MVNLLIMQSLMDNRLFSNLSFLESYLIQKLQQTVPGKTAQNLMLPSAKINPFARQNPKTYKKSAVLILFYIKDKQIHLCFIKRSADNSPHSGQISFPGGKYEENDRNLEQTALRESYEELRILPEKVKLLGALTPLDIPVSQFQVYPVVGIMHDMPKFIRSQTEVERVIEVPIQTFFYSEVRKEKKMIRKDFSFTAPYYEIEDDHIWGATSMIISELLIILSTDSNNQI